MPGVSYYLGIAEMPAISHITGFQIKVHADIIFQTVTSRITSNDYNKRNYQAKQSVTSPTSTTTYSIVTKIKKQTLCFGRYLHLKCSVLLLKDSVCF